MAKLTGLADNAYDLGLIGQGGDMLAIFGNNMGTESQTARASYIAWLDQSQNLYLFGREDGFIGDTRPTVNRACGMLNTFTALATRTEPAITIKSLTASEEGKWILKKPFTMPPQSEGDAPVPLPLFQRDPETGGIVPIPDAYVEHVPPSYRVCIDSKTVTEWAQKNFDIKARQGNFFPVIRDMVHRKQQQGWTMGLFQWDAIDQNGTFELHEPQQWLPDPLAEHVEDMTYVRLDLPTDANKAKRRFPQIAAFIDAHATRAVSIQPGATEYASKYMVAVYARPMITLCYCWLRDQEAPMTLEEALGTGMVSWQEMPEESGESQPDNEQAENAGGRGTPAGQSAAPRLIHNLSGQDITHAFDDKGEPVGHPDTGEFDPLHPRKLVIRQWIQFNGKVIPGTDQICPHWDIPVFADVNVPIIGRPWGRPETERIAPLQRMINNTHAAIADHVAFYKAPTGIMNRELLQKITPDLKNGHMSPGVMYLYDGSGDPEDDIRKKIMYMPPPALPPAVPQFKQDLSADFETVAGHPAVDQGVPPSANSSGVAIQSLQGQSQAAQGFKTQSTERAIRRMSLLKLHAEVHWMTIEEIWRINKSIPLPIVEAEILPFLRSMLLDIEVSMPTGAAQIKMQTDAQTRADFAARSADGQPLIDPETARDELGYDAEEIARRLKNAREELASEQQAAAGPQKNPESIAVSVKFTDLPPSAQNALLQVMGLPPMNAQEAQAMQDQKAQEAASNNSVDSGSRAAVAPQNA